VKPLLNQTFNLNPMKLLVITAAIAFADDIKQILKKSKVVSFSFHDVTGYKNGSRKEETPLWFAGDELHETDSVMFTVIAPESTTQLVVAELNQFNSVQEFTSKIHHALLAVEQTNFS
jgi:nitrogen regulatory protein PII